MHARTHTPTPPTPTPTTITHTTRTHTHTHPLATHRLPTPTHMHLCAQSPFSAPNAIDANAVSQSVRLLAGGLPGGSSKRRQSWLLSSAPICPGAGSGGGSSGGTPAEGMQHVVSAYNSPLGPHRGSNDDPGKDCVSKGDKKVTELRCAGGNSGGGVGDRAEVWGGQGQGGAAELRCGEGKAGKREGTVKERK
eukprot:163668-Chlamydomonas_euryale.AAC.5